MKVIKIFCAGNFIETSTPLQVLNPYNNQTAYQTYMADDNILEEAICKGLQAEREMKHLPVYKRYDILMQIASKLKEHKDEAALILATEAGKPLRLAHAEVGRAIQTFIVAAEESKRLPSECLSIDWTPEAKNKEGIVKYFPIGLTAGISPFNFPLNLAVHKIAPAIAAGCPIILKPATNTPISTLFLSKIIAETELPKGALSVLPMSRTTGNKLVSDARFKLLTFTGSPDVGWQMKNDAGKKKLVLELGGNAGVIVAASADVKYAAQRALVGGFAYSGQICIHAQRFFIHKDLYNNFVDQLLTLVKTLKIGDTLNIDTDFSVMIDEKNAIRAQEWIDEAVAQGAEIACGGKRSANFLEPTMLLNTHKDMKVNVMEVFAPIITITPYTNFKEAVDLLNYGNYGLQAGVFTNALDEMNYAFDAIDAGGVIVNDIPTFRVDHAPYGGIKDSGLGREGVKYAIHDMMEPKILVKNIF